MYAFFSMPAQTKLSLVSDSIKQIFLKNCMIPYYNPTQNQVAESICDLTVLHNSVAYLENSFLFSFSQQQKYGNFQLLRLK